MRNIKVTKSKVTSNWVVRVFARGAAGLAWYTVLPTYATWDDAFAKADNILRRKGETGWRN